MNYATDFHPYGGMWGEGRLPESDASVLSLIVARSLLSIGFGFVFVIVNQLSIEVDSHVINLLYYFITWYCESVIEWGRFT